MPIIWMCRQIIGLWLNKFSSDFRANEVNLLSHVTGSTKSKRPESSHLKTHIQTLIGPINVVPVVQLITWPHKTAVIEPEGYHLDKRKLLDTLKGIFCVTFVTLYEEGLLSWFSSKLKTVSSVQLVFRSWNARREPAKGHLILVCNKATCFAKSQVSGSDQRANRVFSRKLGRKVTSCQTKYLFHDCVLMHMPNAMAF